MTSNIWNKFKLSAGNPRDINIIGVDLGDGETCLSWAEKTTQTNKNIRIRTSSHLYFDTGHASDKQITAFCVEKRGSQQITGEEVMQYSDSTTYVNFKRPLVGDDANQKYEGMFDDDILTYKEIMQQNFQALIRKIFACNPKLLDQPRTVLLIGRPASEIWEKCETEYQSLLKRGLTIPKYTGTVDVVIYSEAQAALAYECKEGHIKQGDTVVIIDGGSSTFDAVIVRNGQIIGEHSRQVGAGMIEDNLLDIFLAWREGEDKLLFSVDTRKKMHLENIKDLTGDKGLHGDISPALLKLKLRERKEAYFGTTGSNGTDDNAFSIYIHGEKRRLFIDDKLMKQAIEAMPVRVRESYLQKNQTAYHEQDYPSFSLAVRAFFEGVYTVCKQAGATPNKVILTGGATVMPFIKTLAEAAFQVPATRAEFPSFSVAEGLSFMGYVEFLKKQVLEEIKMKVHSLIDHATSSISTGIKNAYANAVWTTKYEAGLYDWANTDRLGDTLRQWGDQSKVLIPAESVNSEVQKQLDQNGLYANIKKYLDSEFFNLFPNVHSNYHYTIPGNAIANTLKQVPNLNRVTLSLTTMLGWLGRWFGGDWDKHYTKEQRQKKYATIQARKDKIKEDLGNQFGEHSYAAAQNIASLLKTQIDVSLEDYVEGMTPYFIQYR